LRFADDTKNKLDINAGHAMKCDLEIRYRLYQEVTWEKEIDVPNGVKSGEAQPVKAVRKRKRKKATGSGELSPATFQSMLASTGRRPAWNKGRFFSPKSQTLSV
jgi:hypothetical protein